MCEEYDARQHQSGTASPDQMTCGGPKHRSSGRQCPDMNGMAGRKGIQALARERYAVQVAANHQAIGPFLIKDGFQQMGNDGRGHGRQQDMVAIATGARAFGPAVKPPPGRKRAQNVLVGAPGQGLRNRFDSRGGVLRNGLRDLNVSPGWLHPKKRNRQTQWYRAQTDCEPKLFLLAGGELARATPRAAIIRS